MEGWEVLAMPGIEFKVHNPSGTVEITQRPAPRVANLNGKKVGILWNGSFRGDDTFPFLQQLLKERFPDVDILASDELPFARHTNLDIITRVVKEKGCDVVIGGNGG